MRGFWIPWGVLLAVIIYFAIKVEKDNDISTYKEIVAFMNGKRLDEKEAQQELGKRPYQKVRYLLGSAVFGFVVYYLGADTIYFNWGLSQSLYKPSN